MASTSMSSHADGLHIDTDGQVCSISELGDQHTRLRNEHTPDSRHAISPNRAHEHSLESKHKIFHRHSGAQKDFVAELSKDLTRNPDSSPQCLVFFGEKFPMGKLYDQNECSHKEEKERYERLLKEKEKHELVNQIMRKKNERLKKTLHAKSKK